MNRARLTGIALIVAAAVGYGSGGLFARPAYAAGTDWLTVMAWRFGIAVILAWGVVAVRPSARAAVRAMPRRHLGVTLALGALLVLHSGTYYAGIEKVPLALAGLITAIYPPLVAIFSVWIGRPLEGRRAWMALAMTVGGMVLAVGGIDATATPPLPSLLLVILAPTCYAVWIVLAARHSGETRASTGAESGRVSDGAATGAVLLSGTALAYWVMALATSHPVLPADVPAAAWPGLIGVALSAGFVAPQAFYAGAKRIGGAQAALVSTIEPLYTIVAAGIVLHEALTLLQWAGAVLIISGVVLSQTRGRGAAGAAPLDEPVLPQPAINPGDA